jgi:hypothetical protein
MEIRFIIGIHVAMRCISGTGFSREEARVNTPNL